MSDVTGADQRDPVLWILAVIAVVVAVLAVATRSGDSTEASFTDVTAEADVALPTPQVLPTPVPTPTAPVAAAGIEVAYSTESITLAGTVPTPALRDGLVAAASTLVPADAVVDQIVIDDTTTAEGAVVALSGIVADDSARATVVSAFADLGLVVEDRLTLAGADRSVADVLAQSPRVSEFADFVNLSGLGQELAGAGEGGYTVFAPTNRAVLALDEIALDELSDIASLDQLLRTHVVAGAATVADLELGSTLTTLQGEVLDVTAGDDGSVVVGGARLVTTDIVANNGVVHLVDAVLLPGTLRTEVRLNEIVGRRPVQFASGSAAIEDRSLAILDRVARVLLDNPAGNVEIQGHTDSQGDDELNRELSQERADAVRDYLVAAGVPADRLVARGFGESVPLATPEETDADRATNRRIEFRVRPA
ncbi:MAG: OmpA family protein [Acidimicrobiales bacterium]